MSKDKKHKDAMIAMGIKIASHETLIRENFINTSDHRQEIVNILRTLKLHGEAHMAQDILPQFRDLCKKVESLEGQLNFKLNDGPIHNHTVRITKLEARSADHDESIEALSETVDQSTLSSKMFLERVVEIEILKTQVAGLENRLSRAQDMIAECHPDGFIPIKKPSGRPKKGA